VADAPVWIVDTNVLVSGLLSPSGPPGRLVDVLLGRRLRLALDDRIEAEYREVLARPKLGIEPIRHDAFLAPAIPGARDRSAVAASGPARRG
jgi:hypothetical protein